MAASIRFCVPDEFHQPKPYHCEDNQRVKAKLRRCGAANFLAWSAKITPPGERHARQWPMRVEADA
jgi:hypothetical protein